jgi:hypothetical protein
MSFVRDLSAEGSYAVIGLAIGRDEQITLDGLPAGVYRDAVSGTEIRVSDGRMTFQVRASSAGIYVLNGPGRVGEDGVYLR